MTKKRCSICSSDQTDCKVKITSRPKGETNFNISEKKYYRSIHYCQKCSIYFCQHEYDFVELYRGNYNDSTYRNQITKTYENIMNLPPEQSDNIQRCKRLHHFLSSKYKNLSTCRILDVGSGLSVFLGKMKEYGYSGFAIDPDQNSIHHALYYVKLKGGFCGEVSQFKPDKPFQVITLNKVLEHVKDPKKLLDETLSHLEIGGYCYIELPDGEAASQHGGFIDREEFYIEHYYTYTKRSTQNLLQNSGMKVLQLEAIHEPSDKFTLYAIGQKVS